jgi:DNA-binding response OmpR family regulator
MKALILVVEDEPALMAALRYSLTKEGYDVVAATDGQEALEVAQAQKPDLILLDIMLPKVDGFEVCRILRREMTVPIIMLTARDGEIDKVVGLELGADEYLTKPFSMRELQARVKAMLRRVEMVRQEVKSEEALAAAQRLQAGDLSVDLGEHRVTRRGVLLTLRPKEFDLLTFLMRNRGQVFTRETLLDRVWGYEVAVGTRTVDVHIRWLREKIEDDPSEPRRLETVRGVGYRFVT